MRFKCKPVTIDFLESAPIQLEYRTTVNRPMDETFEALQNPQTWPQWFPGMSKATDITQEGTTRTRTVTLNHVIHFKEDFMVWEPSTRIAYCVSAVSIPYAERLVEDFSLSRGDTGTEICYRVGLEIHRSLRLVSGLIKHIGIMSYQQALPNFKRFIES